MDPKLQERVMPEFSRRSVLAVLPILVAIAALRAPLAADTPPPAAEKRLALKGYDPVSYFTEGHPEKGSSEYSAAFDDATYWFKNAEHRALFVAGGRVLRRPFLGMAFGEVG